MKTILLIILLSSFTYVITSSYSKGANEIDNNYKVDFYQYDTYSQPYNTPLFKAVFKPY